MRQWPNPKVTVHGMAVTNDNYREQGNIQPIETTVTGKAKNNVLIWDHKQELETQLENGDTPQQRIWRNYHKKTSHTTMCHKPATCENVKTSLDVI